MSKTNAAYKFAYDLTDFEEWYDEKWMKKVQAEEKWSQTSKNLAFSKSPSYEKAQICLEREQPNSFFMYFEGGRQRLFDNMGSDHVFVIPEKLMEQLDEETLTRIHPHLNYTIFRHYNRRAQIKTEHEILFLKRTEKDGILIFDGEESKIPVFYCQENVS